MILQSTSSKAASADKLTLVGQVYEQLKSEIFEFSMAPGERFSESEMSTRLGLSRTPLRIALHMLVRDGYMVRTGGHGGWMIRPLDLAYFDDLYDVRTNLELIAVKRICEADPFPDLAELRKVWLVPEKSRSYDTQAVARLDEQFHGALVLASGNRELARIHADLQERIRIIRRLDFTVRERIDEAYLHHGKILRAILSRKETQAMMLLKSHIEASRSEIRHITLHRLALAREKTARAA
jgi:DNA-binding GntR family transcriptional regulator